MTLYSRVLAYLWRNVISRLVARLPSENAVVWGRGVVIYGLPIVSSLSSRTIHIGDRTVLCSDSRFTALGVKQPVVLRTLGKEGEIRIGKDVGISGASICAYRLISIGDECLLGAGVVICDTDFHPVQPVGRRYKPIDDASAKPVMIGRNVFLGAGSIVLKGVSIGDNSVIGAGSVVSKSIPSNCIAAGNPAVVLRVL